MDDINLPEVDPYNTQSAIALLRQHMEYAHVYDMSKLLLKQILSTQVRSIRGWGLGLGVRVGVGVGVRTGVRPRLRHVKAPPQSDSPVKP